jgi:hypothetical protein
MRATQGCTDASEEARDGDGGDEEEDADVSWLEQEPSLWVGDVEGDSTGGFPWLVLPQPPQPRCGGGSRCLYDELFTDGNAETVELCFDAVRGFVGRHFRTVMPGPDRRNMDIIRQRGGPWIKLVYILLAIVHEHALRDQVLADVDDVGTKERIVAFHRAASIAARSLFESPFTDKNAGVLVRRFLYVCLLCWVMLGSGESIENYCDHFGARPARPGAARAAPPSSSDDELATREELLAIAAAMRRGNGHSPHGAPPEASEPHPPPTSDATQPTAPSASPSATPPPAAPDARPARGAKQCVFASFGKPRN